MKHILNLLLALCSLAATGQNLISPITITLPNNPPANTAEWAGAMPPLMITAQTKLVNGKVLPMVTEGKIYVTIKKGGAVVCGYTSAENAPRSNFNSAVKNWSGAAALALLGKTCTLTPGNYEFCVQFYGQIPSAVYQTGIQGEACKPFTIPENAKPETRELILLQPVDGTVIKALDAKKPVNFSYTLIPKPEAQAKLRYNFKMWEIPKGANPAQVIQSGTPPVLERMGPARDWGKGVFMLPPNSEGKDFAWTVVEVEENASAGPPKKGKLVFNTFSVGISNTEESFSPPKNITPENGKIFTMQETKLPITLRWTPVVPNPKGDVIYKVIVWEVKNDLLDGQKTELPTKTRTPLFVKEVMNQTELLYSHRNTQSDWTGSWKVEAYMNGKLIGVSEATEFTVSNVTCHCVQQSGNSLTYSSIEGSGTVSCNTSVTIHSGIVYSLTGPVYVCNPASANCSPVYKWKVDGTQLGTGSSFSHAFTTGSHVLSLSAYCGEDTCQPCTFKIEVTPSRKDSCDCGTWSNLSVQSGTGVKKYECGSTINWSCKVPFDFTTFYHCDPLDKTCKTNITWTVEKPDNTIITGSSGSVGNTISSSFVPSQNGTYTLILNASCDGKKCHSCVYTIVVDNCVKGKCLSVLRDSVICLKPQGQDKKYKFSLTLNNLTGQVCNMLQIVPQIPGSGNVLNVSSISLPTGTTLVTGELTDFVPSNNPFCLRIICTQGTKKCEILYCLKLPSCGLNCDCGTWSKLSVQTATQAVRYECGSTINLSCKTPFKFSSFYQCNPNDKTCQAITTWTLVKDSQPVNSGTGTNQLSDVFSLVENGTYTLTLNARCNGKECPPCVYTIVVKDCPTACDCGKWDNSLVNIQANGTINTRLKCDGTATLSKDTYSIIFPGYTCNPANSSCLVTYTWSVQGPVSGNGNGQVVNFNFSQAGNYTITLVPLCGGKKCPPCKIIINIKDPLPCSLSFTGILKDKYCVGDQVTINWTGTTLPNTVNLVLIDYTNWTVYQTVASGIPNSGTYVYTIPANLPCEPARQWCFYIKDPGQNQQCWKYSGEFFIECCDNRCACNKWGMLTVQTATQATRYECGSTFKWSCNTPFNFTTSYQCLPKDCQTQTSWEIKKGGNVIITGNGTNAPGSSASTINASFTPTENGVYTLTLDASCPGKSCLPCVYTIVVDDCKGRACVSILRDSLWCINEKTGRYGFNLTVQNLTTSNCYLQVSSVPGGGTVNGIGGLPVPSLPPGVSTVSGHLDGVVGVNNQICLRFYCVQSKDTCSIDRCFSLPPCSKACDCGKWDNLSVQSGTGVRKYECGSTINWSCKIPFKFTSFYQCNPNDKTCQAKTTWALVKGSQPVKSGTGTNQLSDDFSLLENGIYTLTLNAVCNGKECTPCVYTIVVDENCIPSVTICNQVWMLKNLDVDTYRDGTPIPQVTDQAVWATLTTGAWCYYQNNSANGTVYGKLYNWYAVNDPRGLAPAGWHVASDSEWTTLSNCFGGDAVSGGPLKEAGTTHWWSPNTGATNSSGFTGLPGGLRGCSGDFYHKGEMGWWHTSTPIYSSYAWYRHLHKFHVSIYRSNFCQRNGMSVRCVKD